MDRRERQNLVRQGVAHWRQYWAENGHAVSVDEAARPQNLAEGLALLAAECRAAEIDEGLQAEIVLKTADFERETLREARHVLAALGYVSIVAVLKRLERSAKPRLTWSDRARERNMEMRRRFRRSLAARARSGQIPN